MAKRVRLYISDDEYELLAKTAKVSGKSLNQFARELLLQSLRQELKDTNLLNRLIQKIENLPQQQNLSINIEPFLQEILNQQRNYFLILYLITRNTLLNISLPESTKHQLIALFNEKERELFGATVYELFGLKK